MKPWITGVCFFSCFAMAAAEDRVQFDARFWGWGFTLAKDQGS